MRVPQIAVAFVHLRVFLLLLLNRGKTLLLLVPHPRGLDGFATDEERDSSDQANELKRFHGFIIQQVGFRGSQLLATHRFGRGSLTRPHLQSCCHRPSSRTPLTNEQRPRPGFH